MPLPYCFDCRFFVADGRVHNDLTEAEWDEALEGTCHVEPPVLGGRRKDRHGEPFRDFGEWPKVMASDWCGRFVPARQDAGPPPPRTFKAYRLATAPPAGGQSTPCQTPEQCKPAYRPA